MGRVIKESDLLNSTVLSQKYFVCIFNVSMYLDVFPFINSLINFSLKAVIKNIFQVIANPIPSDSAA